MLNAGDISEEITGGSLSASCLQLKSTISVIQVPSVTIVSYTSP